ncbi:hypothetical protein RHMOL_Rhmol12G0130100 [Rhododendron molle]|uniref:Uncharacterized protein n=1 Tax=Rhododendron molle TaxID=49168 RepID=A0ACC0LHW4_RHOML|nr:hypothetical protein RHMOL_Rhmol12G0130100 [Rhododendron molle]
MAIGNLGSVLSGSVSDLVASTCVGDVVVHLPPSPILCPVSGRFDLNYAGEAGPRVSSTEAVRTSPGRVSTIASIRTSPSTSPRVSLAAHPRASALTSSSFPLSGIDLLEQVSIPVVDSLKQGAFVPVNASNGPRVAQSWSNVNLGKHVAPGHSAWQVVGTLRKDASGLVGHRPPSSLQTALPSTSQPVNPGPVKGTPVTTKGNTVVEHAVNTFAILDSSALDEDGALPIGSKGTPPGSSLGNKYALGLREDVLDVDKVTWCVMHVQPEKSQTALGKETNGSILLDISNIKQHPSKKEDASLRVLKDKALRAKKCTIALEG